jgi:hypothetical protein
VGDFFVEFNYRCSYQSTEGIENIKLGRGNLAVANNYILIINY